MEPNKLLSAVDCTLFTYLLMNRHTETEERIARATLTPHLDRLIANGEHDQQRLIVKGLTHLRELEEDQAARKCHLR
jgi:hypothetical protein